ncbi:hypothetical protein ACFQ60_36710 [Streptomyces zhihengii]
MARAPRRIRWRAEGQVPLEFRSRGNKLHLHSPVWTGGSGPR